MSIRTRIVLVFIVTTTLGVVSLLVWLNDEMRPRYLEAQEDILVDMARVLAVFVRERALVHAAGEPRLAPADLGEVLDEALDQRVDAQIYSLRKQRVDLRIYVTDAAGIVRYDSDGGRDLGADYSRWRDVHRTLAGEYGARSTEGDLFYPDGTTMYIAAPIQWGERIMGVVTVGKPTRNAERFRVIAVRRISQAGFVFIGISVGVGLMVYWWVSHPLQRLARFARAVEAGEREPLPALGENEIGQVGQAIDAMRSALDGKSYVADYVQALTHELKSPTAGIRGAAELLAEEGMSDARRGRFISNIVRETDRIQDIVDRLLALAEIEGYQGLERLEPVSLGTLITTVADALFPLASDAQVGLQTVLADCPPVRGDPFLLHQAIDNLVKNAIEFSPHGGQVTVQTGCNAQEAWVIICDAGPGIPDYAKGRIFERFYSLPRPDGAKGTGLGLSFVREIAALHHGRIELTNGHAGAGTVARLSLPAAAAVARPAGGHLR